MKKFSILGLFLTILFTSLGAKKTVTAETGNGHNIVFEVKGTKIGDTIQLAYYVGQHDKYGLESKAYVDEKGMFSFKNDTSKIRKGLYLVVIPEKGFFEIIINDDQNFTVSTDVESYVNNMKIKGNDENIDYYAYLKNTLPIQQKYTPLADTLSKIKDDTTNNYARDSRKELIKLNKELSSIKSDFATQHPDYFIKKILTINDNYDVPEFDEITDSLDRKNAKYYYYRDEVLKRCEIYPNSPLLRSPVFKQQLDKYLGLPLQIHDTLIKHSDMVVKMVDDDYDMFRYMVIHLTKYAENIKYMCMEKYKWHMYNKYYLNDKRVDWIKPDAEKKIERFEYMMRYNHCGLTAPELTMKDTSGLNHRLGAMKNEYTIVVFWSATCGHCKKAIPQLHEKYLELRENYDLEVFSVHIDKETKKWKEFITKNKFEWIDVNDEKDENQFRVKYNVFSTPTIFLLNGQKKIIAKRFDVDLLDKILEDQENKASKN